MKQLRLEANDDLHKKLKMYAVDNDMRMPAVVVKALEQFFKDEKETK